jgi:hypothetical protein
VAATVPEAAAQMPVQHPQSPAKTEDTKQIEDLAMRYFLC